MKQIDLHIHSTISDSSASIDEIMQLAHELEIGCLSITDHDTVAGIARAVEAGSQHDITVIPGIELSASDAKRGNKVHVLGYDFDPENPNLKAFCQTMIDRRQKAALEMIEKLRNLDFEITAADVMEFAADSTNIYKQHIMATLMKKGYATEMFGDLKNELFSSKSGKAYVPVKYPDAGDAVRVLKNAGGIPVLAHPGLQGNWEIIPELIQQGLEGIETCHSGHSSEMTRKAESMAEHYNLLKTAGSDFHGTYDKTPVTMGCNPTPVIHFLKQIGVKT